MAQQQHDGQRLLELQVETLKRENEMLKREVSELRNMYDQLKESLDKAVRHSMQQAAHLGQNLACSQPTEDTVDLPEGTSIHISHSCSISMIHILTG